jgi:uncharacterized protein (TIGR02466 family)
MDHKIIVKELTPFSTSIYQTKINIDHTILLGVDNLSQDPTNFKNASNIGGWHSRVYFEADLTTREELQFIKPIIEKILPVVQAVYNSIGLTKSVTVDGFWFMNNKRYNYNRLHNHPGCWVSGVIYLKVPKNSGRILFERPDPMHDFLQIDAPTDKSIQEYYWDPSVGDVVLFPSYLKHYVEQNLADEIDDSRICLAINFK